MTPTSSRRSRAEATSPSAPSTSGSGRQAKPANRSGRSRIISAENSLHGRASTRAAASSRVGTPGVLMEVTATSMPASSRNESALARDQGGGAMPPTGLSPSLVACQKKSGSTWWWISTVNVMSGLIYALVDAFGQHDDRDVDDLGGDTGQDRGVGDPQPADAVDGTGGVDDGPWVTGSAHRRRGGGVAVHGHVAGDDLCQGSVVGDP